MLVFGLSGPNLVSIPNFSSISLQMADFSLFFEAKSCEVPSVILLSWLRGSFCDFVAMATAKNLINWFDLQNVS